MCSLCHWIRQRALNCPCGNLQVVGINEERSTFDVLATRWHANQDGKVMLLRDFDLSSDSKLAPHR